MRTKSKNNDAVGQRKAFCEKIESCCEKIRINHLYIFLGVVVIVHIFWIILSKGVSPINKNELDGNIPFNLLMFALVMASFVPMLVYTYTFSILREAKNREPALWDNANKFYDMINFIVNQSTILITIAILIGCSAFIEIEIRHNIVTCGFLIGYYFWYFFVAIVWSIQRSWTFQKNEEKKKELKNKKHKNLQRKILRKMCRRYIFYYLWILFYITISIILLTNYLNNYFCPNSTVWLKYLIIVTSLWLLSFSILWIIPSDLYYPLWGLKKSYSEKEVKKISIRRIRKKQ